MKWIISVVIGVIGFYFTLKQAEGENISKAVVCFLAAILTGLVTSFIYDAIKPMFMDSGSTYVIETTGSPVTSSYEESAPYETTEEETSPPKTEPHSTEQSSLRRWQSPQIRLPQLRSQPIPQPKPPPKRQRSQLWQM